MVALPTVTRPAHLAGMRRAGRAAALTLDGACALVKPGVRTADLDRFVRDDTRRRGGVPAQHGYIVDGPPFSGHVCTSVNDVVCHGVPREDCVLRDGDLITLDCTTELDGWHGDTARTVVVGRPSPEAAHLVQVARRALELGIAAVRPWAPLSVIGEAIEPFVVASGCAVVRDYGGHGIGRRMHQPPSIHHHRQRSGIQLVPGLCFTIEPMVVLGSPLLSHDADGWTVRTADGSLAAQFEHSLRVTEDGVEVLTAL